ncbi:MAG: hypothetical protein ABW098_03075 [Candidatus Thiodiazotropha sp.]
MSDGHSTLTLIRAYDNPVQFGVGLACIRLRQDDREGARAMLTAIAHIDPHDNVGADVIRELLEGVEGEGGDG